MSLISRKIAAFAKKVANLSPKPGGTMPVAELQAQFDAAPEELRAALNGAIDDIVADYATKSELNGLVLGQVPNGSITEPKLETSLSQKVNGGLVDSISRQAMINGGFDMWQRGTSFTTPANLAYTADRWSVTYDGTIGTFFVARQAFPPGYADVPNNPKYYLTWNQAAAGSGSSYRAIRQKIESVRTFAGQAITLSFWARADAARQVNITLRQHFGTGGSPSPVVDTSYGPINLSTTWQKITATITLPSISGKTLGSNGDDVLELMLYLPINTVMSVDVAQFQINAGDYALPFQPRSFAEELALCQRYYEKSYDYGVAPGTSTSNGAENVVAISTDNLAKQDTRFKVRKRVVPTVTVYSAQNGAVGNVSEFTGGGVFGSDRAVNTSLISENSYVIGKPAAFNANSFERWHWTADAEL